MDYYSTLISIIGLIIGTLLIVFREKVADNQKKQAAKLSNPFAEAVKTYPRSKYVFLAVFVGLMFVLVSLFKLVSILR